MTQTRTPCCTPRGQGCTGHPRAHTPDLGSGLLASAYLQTTLWVRRKLRLPTGTSPITNRLVSMELVSSPPTHARVRPKQTMEWFQIFHHTLLWNGTLARFKCNHFNRTHGSNATVMALNHPLHASQRNHVRNGTNATTCTRNLPQIQKKVSNSSHNPKIPHQKTRSIEPIQSRSPRITYLRRG